MPPEEDTPAADAVGTPVVDAPVADAPVDTPAVDTDDADTFTRDYVEKLRQENAGHRTKYQKYAKAFDGYGDDEQDVILDLARQILESPEGASRRMIEISRSLAGDKFDDLLKDDGPKYLTEEDFQRKLAETDAQKQQEADIQAVQNEAKELGYSDDPDDPEGQVRHAELFLRAFKHHGGDLKAADAAIKANDQKVIDSYLKAKAEGGSSFVATTADGTSAAEPDDKPKTFNDASNRLRALLEAQPGE